MNIIKTNCRKVVLDAYYSYVLKDATGYQSYYYNLDNKDYGLDKSYEIEFDELLKDKCNYFWQSPIKYNPFLERFKQKNIKFIIASCSGHAHPNDLIKIIDLIKPKLLVPIHSYRPEKLYNKHGDILLPKKGQTI